MAARRPEIDRFNDKVERQPGADGCHNWVGFCDPAGYPRFTYWVEGKGWVSGYAHIWAWMHANGGPVPDGLEVSHTCHNKRCVRADGHLVAETHADNIARSPNQVSTINAAKTHCKRGHALTGANVERNRHGHRFCLMCKADADHVGARRRYQRRRYAEQLAADPEGTRRRERERKRRRDAQTQTGPVREHRPGA
jgi:HNH endonuclease